MVWCPCTVATTAATTADYPDDKVRLVAARECLEYLNKIEYFLILGIQDLNIF